MARACRQSSAPRWESGGKGWTKACLALAWGWPSCGIFPGFTGVFSRWTTVRSAACWRAWNFRQFSKRNRALRKFPLMWPCAARGLRNVSISQQDKTGLLKAFLGGLPSAAAGRLAMAVEVDRLMDGHVLPHGEILDGLRPILRRDRIDRTLTPLRLFCRPFQDLLTCDPRKAKQKACIARSSLAPAWNWIQTLLPDEAAAYGAECRTLVLAHKPKAALARAAQ